MMVRAFILLISWRRDKEMKGWYFYGIPSKSNEP